MRLRKAAKAEITYDGIAPIRVLMGWSEGISRNDAVELAKGYIQKRFTSAPESGWYAVSPFMGGYMWEVQEAGPGVAYMPAALEALSRDPGGRHWFPCGDRAFQVMMRDGKPFAILLSGADSKSLIDSGAEPLMPSGRMLRAVRKGDTTFITGAAMFGSGFSFLAGAMIFYGLAADPAPQVKDVNLLMAPHAQWGRVADTGVREVVTKIEMKKGVWKVEKRPHVIQEDPIELPPSAPQPSAPASAPAVSAPMEAIAPTEPAPASPIPIETPQALAPASQPPVAPENKPDKAAAKMDSPTEVQPPKVEEVVPVPEPAIAAPIEMIAPLPPPRPIDLGGLTPPQPIPEPIAEPNSHEPAPIPPSVDPAAVPTPEIVPAPEPVEILNLPPAAPPPEAQQTSTASNPVPVVQPAIAPPSAVEPRQEAAKPMPKIEAKKVEAKRPDHKPRKQVKPNTDASTKNDGGKQE